MNYISIRLDHLDSPPLWPLKGKGIDFNSQIKTSAEKGNCHMYHTLTFDFMA